MNQWVERFENHSFHASLEALETSLDKCEGLQLEPDELLAVERLKQIVGLLKTKIQLIDPALAVEGTLKNIDSQLSKANSEVSQFVSSRRIQNLKAANNHADGLLVQISNIPTIQDADDVAEVRDAVGSLRMAVGQYMHHLEKEKDEIKAEIDDLSQRAKEIKSQVESQKNRVDNTISQFQEQFSEAQSKRQERSAQAQRERDKKFSDALQDLNIKSTEFLSEKEEEVGKLIESFRKDREANEEELKAEADTLIEAIEKHKSKAGELVQIINNSGMVGGFQTEANAQRNWAIFWSVVTVLSLVGLIGFAIFAFKATVESGEFDLGLFGARAFVAASFGILAAYSARQAEKHRKAERRNRRLELEIASIGPYLSDLPPEMQHEVRKNIADRVFGNLDESKEQSSDEAMTGSAVDLLKMTLNNLTKN